jgi:hypothetical protein
MQNGLDGIGNSAMSLVHEALLKAEREKQRKTGGLFVLAQRAQPVASRPTPTREERPVTLTRASTLPQTPVSPAPACEPSRSLGTAHVAASEPRCGGSDAAHVAAPSQKSHQTVLVFVAVCVALVAIVAIVFMVNRSALTPRKSESSGGLGSVPTVSTPARPEPSTPTETLAQPAVTPSPIDVSRYKITGIMKDPQGNYCAVINGRVISVEQYIDGATVKKIERDRVTLDENGREFVVRLN